VARARNNLKDISLRVPKRQITIFTGVSGSGKSSIVFDTIATEAQRQLYEELQPLTASRSAMYSL
jgi:excinuclease UvrABC ATPase subunit